MRNWLPVLQVLLFLFVSRSVRAQISDSAAHASALGNAVIAHNTALKDQLPILNGSVYVEYPYTFTSGSPFFPPGHFQPGSVVYDEESYQQIPLVFDELSGDVIAQVTLNIRLVPEKISSFTIGEHRFVRLPVNLLPGASGFYEWLAEGDVSLYKKVGKKLDVKRAKLGTEVYATVDETISYLLEKQGRMYPVNSKSQLLAQLKDKNDALKRFIADNHLALAPGNYEYGLLKVIFFYNGNNNK